VGALSGRRKISIGWRKPTELLLIIAGKCCRFAVG